MWQRVTGYKTRLVDVAEDYRVQDKVSGCVHDNASNQALAGSMLEEEQD